MSEVKTLVLLSGGLDSTVLLADVIDAGNEVAAITFDYRQRHRVELAAAGDVADWYGVEHLVVDLTGVGRLIGGASALTSRSVAVPHGHYADASMRSTVVPGRNAIMLMTAAGAAAARGFHRVATAVHAGDHPVYPDCRPEFIDAAHATTRAATAGIGDVSVYAPYVAAPKQWIVRRGAQLAAPLRLTWSCYEGGDMHCGRCGTCVERHEAFLLAGVPDPTEYARAEP